MPLLMTFIVKTTFLTALPSTSWRENLFTGLLQLSTPSLECHYLLISTHPSDELDIDFTYCQGAPYLLMKMTTVKFQAIRAFNRIIHHNKNNLIPYKCSPNDIINGIEKVLNIICEVSKSAMSMLTMNLLSWTITSWHI